MFFLMVHQSDFNILGYCGHRISYLVLWGWVQIIGRSMDGLILGMTWDEISGSIHTQVWRPVHSILCSIPVLAGLFYLSRTWLWVRWGVQAIWPIAIARLLKRIYCKSSSQPDLFLVPGLFQNPPGHGYLDIWMKHPAYFCRTFPLRGLVHNLHRIPSYEDPFFSINQSTYPLVN